MLSDNLLLVDVAIFPFIRQFASVDMNMFNNKYVNITSWLNNILASSLYLSVMDKYHEYKLEQAPVIINFNK